MTDTFAIILVCAIPLVTAILMTGTILVLDMWRREADAQRQLLYAALASAQACIPEIKVTEADNEQNVPEEMTPVTYTSQTGDEYVAESRGGVEIWKDPTTGSEYEVLK